MSSAAPVTLKIRTGWDENSINAKEVALRAREIPESVWDKKGCLSTAEQRSRVTRKC